MVVNNGFFGGIYNMNDFLIEFDCEVNNIEVFVK